MKLAAATLIAVLTTTGAEAQGWSADYVLPGCRRAAASVGANDEETILKAGVCIGVSHTLIVTGSLLTPAQQFCPPASVTAIQAAQVALSYIDARPARWHERFHWLALEAFREAWPCK
jgi:hypothetical protein